MIENRVVAYNPSGWTHGCSVTDRKWKVTINLRNIEEVLNFYNFFGFVLSEFKKDEKTIGYYHWSRARITTPLTLTSKEYIFERDNEEQKDRIQIEEELFGDFLAKINKLDEEKRQLDQQYNPSAMYWWLMLGILTFFMCPVYLIKRKNKNRVLANINKKIDAVNKELLDKVNFEITKFEDDSRDSKESETDCIEAKHQQGDYIEEIKRLKDLLDSGIITLEEFEAKKKQLLNIENKN